MPDSAMLTYGSGSIVDTASVTGFVSMTRYPEAAGWIQRKRAEEHFGWIMTVGCFCP